jgi:hypothetical protein
MDQHFDLYLSSDDLRYADVDLTDSLTTNTRPVITIGDRSARTVTNIYGGTRGAPIDPMEFADTLERWAARLRALQTALRARLAEEPHEGAHAHCGICRESQDRIETQAKAEDHVVDLMAALEESVAKAKEARARHEPKAS